MSALAAITHNSPAISLGNSVSIPRIVRNISKLAIPIFAIFAIASIPIVSANSESFWRCIETCQHGNSPVAKTLCSLGCLLLLPF